ncbi:hypothetical protein A2U01_0093977 [Trifolium medium]|uniref:Uncharacterized protein n=1 Tax=Trifolium medium TaxID=97028 RepID=A0A392UGK5_9FABA|nr:hypothetical protein [Trifolium medium]
MNKESEQVPRKENIKEVRIVMRKQEKGTCMPQWALARPCQRDQKQER